MLELFFGDFDMVYVELIILLGVLNDFCFDLFWLVYGIDDVIWLFLCCVVVLGFESCIGFEDVLILLD